MEPWAGGEQWRSPEFDGAGGGSSLPPAGSRLTPPVAAPPWDILGGGRARPAARRLKGRG